MFGHGRCGNLSAAVALTAALIAGTAPGAGAAQVRQVTERVFPFEPGGELRVDSQNGRVSVEAWNRSEVRIQITREVRAGEEKQASELMKSLSADVEVGKDRITVRSVYPKRGENVGLWDIVGQRVGAVNIHYYIQVPRETRLVLKTSNGEIRVRGTSGDLTGATVNGNVEVTGVKGVVQIHTTNGEVHLASIEGSADAGTTNGAVQAELKRLTPGTAVELTTTNGDVTIALPGDLKADIDAATTNGRVRVDFPLTTQGDISSKRIRGSIAGGGTPISLRTTNGNIEITKIGGKPRL